MSIHPAHAIPFNDLVAQLTAAVRDGHVSERRHPDRPDLALYCYTNRCVYENAWTPVIEAARGLVIDHGTRCVVATPFPKFFNHGERTAAMPDEPFEVFDKLDGSLGVVFFDDVASTWRVATKGSFTSSVGLYLSQIKQPARQFIFARRKHGPTWHALPKFRTDVCRTFRPTANVLAGYSPSAAMHRFADDA